VALRRDSYVPEMQQGIFVFYDAEAPGLPMIGLRTIIGNKLPLSTMVIVGRRR